MQHCEKLSSLSSLSSNFSNLKIISGGVGVSSVVLSGIDNQISSQDETNVALKRLSLVGKGKCRVALRELRLLRKFNHDNIIRTYKITDLSGKTIEDPSMENFKDMEAVYIVEELCDTDLHKVIEKYGKLPLETVKLFMYQLFRGLKYIHSANVIHRDIKPGNLFIKMEDLTLKIGDYGLSRVFDKRYDHNGYLTALVSTRYYRAPEIMLDLGNYSFGIDIWSAGCLFGEMLLGKILFCGDNDLDQINVICEAFGVDVQNINSAGSFPQHLFLNSPPEAIDLLSKLLCLNPSERITAEEALQHPFFSELHDPEDEPICERPFFIEHEVDNLPVKILKRKILRNSCVNIADKNSFDFSEEKLFKDFDEMFTVDHKDINSNKIRNFKLDSSKEYSDFSEHKSCSSSSFDSYASHSSRIEIDNESTTYSKKDFPNKDSYLPSLNDAISELSDEPYRDPGLCSRKYHDSTKQELNVNNYPSPFESDQQETYFSGLSPVIEISDAPKFFDEYPNQSLLETHGHVNHDSCSNKNHHKCKRKISSKHKNFSNIKSLNEEIIRKLNSRVTCQCGLEELVSSKLKSQAPSIVHWDSLRFWI